MAADTSNPPRRAPAPLPIPKRRRLPWWAHLTIVLIALLLIGGGLYGLWYASAQSELQAEIAAARERGEPVWFSDVEPPPVPGDENGAAIFLNATSSLPWALKDLEPPVLRADQVARFGDSTGGRKVNDPALRAELDKLRDVLAGVRLALQKPHCQFPIVYSSPKVDVSIDWTGKPRWVALVLAAEFHLALAEGDVPGAVQAIDDMYAVSELLRDVPYVASQYFRIRAAGMATDELAILVGQASLSDEQFARIDARLDALASSFRLRDAVLSERACDLTIIDNLSQHKDIFGGVEELRHYPSGLLRPLVLEDEALVLRHTSAAAEAIDMTGPAGVSANNAVAAEIAAIPTHNALAHRFLDHLPHVRSRGMMHRQRLACARVGLRIDRYYRRHGKLPADLSELIDEQLKEIPQCLLSEKPLIFKRDDSVRDGFLLYAPGENGVDDGGGRLPDMHEGWSTFNVIYNPAMPVPANKKP